MSDLCMEGDLIFFVPVQQTCGVFTSTIRLVVGDNPLHISHPVCILPVLNCFHFGTNEKTYQAKQLSS